MDMLHVPKPLMFGFGILLGIYLLIAVVLETFRIIDGVHILSPYLPNRMKGYFIIEDAVCRETSQIQRRTLTDETDHLVG